ncbi:MAG TPA: efflux RND transporter periplasmic adaptor subunit [Kofleriaceae bacterium]|jgi:multidrug efflux system membrane fusion protein|nr:efflux RND transporter periplasmic adaptor subunit [Kofleriaceae bacterium]
MRSALVSLATGAAAAAIAASSLAAAGCHHDPIPVPQPTAVKVALVEHAANVAGTHYSAQINPATRLDLSFKVGGYVDSVATVPGVDGKPRLLQEGDTVRAGMQLAAIRSTDYAQRLAEAQAALAQAKVGLDQAELDFTRTQKLADTNAIAGAELDAARTKRDGATATLSGARSRVDQAATALSDSVLRSPLTGIVLKRSVEVGALAAPGTVAFSVADVGSVKAAFGVPDTVLPRVHLGAALTITTEAYPGEKFEGRISLIAPSADPRSRVFEVDVTIPNADGRLKPGSVAALSLEGAGDPQAAAAPLIPLSAIVRSPGHPTQFAVFVVDTTGGPPTVHARDVELGEYLGRVIPVQHGLKGGETVVVQGAGLLSDGEHVEVIQ